MLGTSLDDEQDYARVVYYGDPGSGKTSAAAALANMGDVAFFPIEPGLKKVALTKLGIPTANIKPVRTSSCEEIMENFWKLRELLATDPNAVAGVVFDSFTELVSRTITAITKREYEKAVRDAEAAGEEYEKPKYWVSQNWWGESTGDIREVIEHYHDLPTNLAITAHVRRDEDDDGEVSYGPAVNPAIQSDLVGYADVIMWTRVVGQYANGRPIVVGTTLDPTGKHKVKDRLGVLPSPTMAYPSMDRIVAYVRGQLTEDKDPLQKEFLKWKEDLGKARIAKKNKES